MSDAVIYQDNQIEILRKTKGKALSGKRTRHINIRYFSVTDRLASKEVRIDYCPAREMLADFFTKRLPGSPYRKFQDVIMYRFPASDSLQEHKSEMEIDDSSKVEDKENDDPGWTLVTSLNSRKGMKSDDTLKSYIRCYG